MGQASSCLQTGAAQLPLQHNSHGPASPRGSVPHGHGWEGRRDILEKRRRNATRIFLIFRLLA